MTHMILVHYVNDPRPLAGFFVYRHFSLHSIDGIRMSKRKHIEKIDERVDR